MHKLIVIDGGDGAGKHTQADLLLSHMAESKATSLIDFPRYQTPTGEVISRMRHARINLVQLDPYVASGPFTLDRLAAKPHLEEQLRMGHVIADRYVPANIAYQAAKLEGQERKEFVAYIEELEYICFGLPRPDAVVFLHVPVDVSRRLMEERAKREGRTLDQNEAQADYQGRVTQVYRDLCKQREDWYLVDCAPDGVLRSRKDIHEEICSLIDPLLHAS